jgi:hypothetical protein
MPAAIEDDGHAPAIVSHEGVDSAHKTGSFGLSRGFICYFVMVDHLAAQARSGRCLPAITLS